MKSPPLNALYVFEAFARRGRMGAAADELGVTHGAVSRQIRHLEALLGLALVSGPKNRLALTEAGLKLADQLTTAFRTIEASLPDVGDGTRGSLHVSCLGSLAMKWLIPRLPRFYAAYPGVQVRISESNSPCDFRRDGVDLAIRVVFVPDDAIETTVFMKQFHGPVLAPPLLGKSADPTQVLNEQPRLYALSYPQSWAEWRKNTGFAIDAAKSERSFEHNTYMIEAAAAGLGAAVCPWVFVMDDVEKGRLSAPFGFVATAGAFAALRPKDSVNRAAARFRDWLVQEGRATPAPL